MISHCTDRVKCLLTHRTRNIAKKTDEQKKKLYERKRPKAYTTNISCSSGVGGGRGLGDVRGRERAYSAKKRVLARTCSRWVSQKNWRYEKKTAFAKFESLLCDRIVLTCTYESEIF